jgi:glycosyltransferase involved in cell wall biosynthesis
MRVGDDRSTMSVTRTLFVSEDLHGRHVLGPQTYDAALRLGLRGRNDVDARFLRVGPPRLAGRVLTHTVPLLHGADLDFHHLRWFAVHARRTRRLIAAELARHPVDVVHVNTHAITLGASPVPADVPLLLSADAAVWDWRTMSSSLPVRRHSWRVYEHCRRLERRTLMRAHTVLAYTEWARGRLQEAAPDANIVHLQPGVDLDYFRPAPHAPRDRHRLVFVGGRFREKGGEDLLAAMDTRLGVDVELDVVTSEPVRERPGLRVHQLSRLDPRLLELLQQADVFCLPTYADTMSFATMEALACGTPAVASALGGVPETVGDAGATVRPGDVRGIREAVDALLGDPATRSELRLRARRRAEERFDARRQTAQLLDIVHDAARGRAIGLPASSRVA